MAMGSANSLFERLPSSTAMLHSIHCERADRIDAKPIERGIVLHGKTPLRLVVLRHAEPLLDDGSALAEHRIAWRKR